MTNDDIKLYYIPDKKHQHHVGLFNHEDTRKLMDLARADEREKLKKQVCTCCLERIFKEATNDK